MTTTDDTVSALDRPDDAGTEPGSGRAPHLPGESSMWVFVLGDMVIFAIYFIIFMVERTREHALFLASQQHLNQNIGLSNTLLLLASSWFVASAVRATKDGLYQWAMRLVEGGGVCGVLFIALKIVEWTLELRHGNTFAKNDFFTFYYMLTGVHLFHVVMGLVILGVVVRELRTPTLRRVSIVEAGATYWHLVDLLWIVLFALVYVMR